MADKAQPATDEVVLVAPSQDPAVPSLEEQAKMQEMGKEVARRIVSHLRAAVGEIPVLLGDTTLCSLKADFMFAIHAIEKAIK